MDGTMIRRAFPYAVGTAVVAAIVGGLVLVGSPSAERRRRLDEVRVNDLTQLKYAVDLYWNREGTLPPSVDALATMPDARFRSTMDPSTSEPYAYRAIDATRYELCATFETEDAAGRPFGDRFWAHGAGRKCFEVDAQKQLAR
jgi:hypothetical protein